LPSNGRGKNSASLDWFLPKAAPFGAAFEIRFDSHDTKKEMHPFRVHLFFGGAVRSISELEIVSVLFPEMLKVSTSLRPLSPSSYT
jgi:hypothetical protein